MAEEASKRLLEDVKLFRKADTFSDLVITCGSDTYNVHKVVVCTRSSFFAKAVKFPMGKEAGEGKIDLPEDEPAVVKLLIEYLYEAEYEPRLLPPPTQNTSGPYSRYTAVPQKEPHSCKVNGEYLCDNGYETRAVCSHHYCGNSCGYNCVNYLCDQCAPTVAGTAGQLLTHAQMYEIGDKYHVSGLKELAKAKFQQVCIRHWNDPEFAEAANYAFSTTPEDDKGLRDVVCKTISGHIVLLKKPEIEALLTEFNGLAFGLLKEKAEQSGWFK